MMSRTYATETEYKDWLGAESVPSGAARLLRDASIDVDDMLITAIYNVDHDDKPTDPKVIAALRDATCAQAEHRDEWGDDVDIITSGEAVKLGPLSLGGTGGRGNGNESARVPQYAPRALRILRNAGLITGVIQDA